MKSTVDSPQDIRLPSFRLSTDGSITCVRARALVATCVTIAIAGCAGVTVTPLNPDGLTRTSGAVSGLRYYLPMPYLLVTELPPSASATDGGGGNTADKKKPPYNPDPKKEDQNTANNAGSFVIPNPSPTPTPTPGITIINSPANTPFGEGAPGAGASDKGTDTANNPVQSTPGGSSNNSFGAVTPQYVVKLIYLPDKLIRWR